MIALVGARATPRRRRGPDIFHHRIPPRNGALLRIASLTACLQYCGRTGSIWAEPHGRRRDSGFVPKYPQRALTRERGNLALALR
jgi:hypothetical protein